MDFVALIGGSSHITASAVEFASEQCLQQSLTASATMQTSLFGALGSV